MPASTRSVRSRASSLERDDRRRGAGARRQRAPAGGGPRRSTRRRPARTSTRASTRDAKTYRYRIWNAGVMSPFERAYAWHVPAPRSTSTRWPTRRRALEGRARLRGVSGDRQRHARPSASARSIAVVGRARRRSASADRLRGRRRRLPPAHGADHRRHAGRGRARAAARRLDGRRARLARSRGGRADGAGAGPVPGGGRLRRPSLATQVARSSVRFSR